MDWEVDAAAPEAPQARSPAPLKGADELILATDPDREGEAISWHVLEVLRAAQGAARASTVKRVVFNAITKTAVLEAMAHPREIDQRAGRRLSGAPRARLSRRLHPLAGPVAQAAGLPLGRPRAVGGAAPDLRARGRDREVQGRRNTGRSSADCRPPPATPFTARLTHLDGKKLDKFDLADRGQAEARRRHGRAGAPSPSPRSRSKPAKRNPFAALHHLDPAAGGLAQARLRRPPAPCRSPSSSTRASTSAARRSASSPTCAPTASTLAQRSDRPARALIGERLRRRATCPTSRASTRPRPRTRRKRTRPSARPICSARPRRRRMLDARPAQALRPDLEAHGRQPDGERRARPADVDIAAADGSAMLRATGSVVTFDGFLAVYQEGRDDAGRGRRRRAAGACPPLKARATRQAPARSRPSSTSPSRRRATPKPAWSRSWRNSASAGPRPTPRSSQVLQDRNYVPLDKQRFIPEDRGRIVTAFLDSFFHALRRVRLHRRSRGAARRHLRRRARLEGRAARLLEGLQPPAQPVRRPGRSASMGDAVSFLDTGIGKRSVVIDVLNDTLAPHFFPDRRRRQDPRLCPACADRPARPQARQVRRLHRLQQLSGMPLHARLGGATARNRQRARPAADPSATIRPGPGGHPAQRPLRPLRAARRGRGRGRHQAQARLAAEGDHPRPGRSRYAP